VAAPIPWGPDPAIPAQPSLTQSPIQRSLTQEIAKAVPGDFFLSHYDRSPQKIKIPYLILIFFFLAVL
jgi:hypothetical protein